MVFKISNDVLEHISPFLKVKYVEAVTILS